MAVVPGASCLSRLALAIYYVCLALVFSFVLFEVLDVDGSDFPASPNTPTTLVKLAESDHDIKRTYLHSPPRMWVAVSALVLNRVGESAALGRAALLEASPLGLAGPHVYRVMLPRASLPAPFPA